MTKMCHPHLPKGCSIERWGLLKRGGKKVYQENCWHPKGVIVKCFMCKSKRGKMTNGHGLNVNVKGLNELKGVFI